MPPLHPYISRQALLMIVDDSFCNSFSHFALLEEIHSLPTCINVPVSGFDIFSAASIPGTMALNPGQQQAIADKNSKTSSPMMRPSYSRQDHCSRSNTVLPQEMLVLSHRSLTGCPIMRLSSLEVRLTNFCPSTSSDPLRVPGFAQ